MGQALKVELVGDYVESKYVEKKYLFNKLFDQLTSIA